MVASTRASSSIHEIMQPAQDFFDPVAQEISNTIDEELKTEGLRRKEAKRLTVNVVLLGQAESGKSTLQKQFQHCYAAHTLQHERPSWRPVVYSNIITAVRTILDEIDHHAAADPQSSEDELAWDAGAYVQISIFRGRLMPLVALEQSLAAELNGGVSIAGGRAGIYVRPGWRDGRWPQEAPRIANMVARALADAQDTIAELWQHPSVQALIRLRKLRLEETAAFFLDDIQRVAEPDYSPSYDDILRVRLQTLGIIEHAFAIKVQGISYNWRMYDVGGARGQRHAWVPYFDDATAVIFLAPISAFDQFLDEDPHVNRIHDSLQLFGLICSNNLLKKTHLILMLNKTDLLKKKLKSGIQIRKYITSYGDRPNKYEPAAEYFRTHFEQAHARKDIAHRRLFTHFTSMLDTKAMQKIIANVGEGVIRSHVAQTGLV
jgi:guanine nucleotide-binding protein subunit alpha